MKEILKVVIRILVVGFKSFSQEFDTISNNESSKKCNLRGENRFFSNTHSERESPMKHLFLIIMFTATLLSQPNTLAILQFEGVGISQGEANVISSRLEGEIFKLGKYMVLERNEMDVILREQEFQQSGCVSSECAVEVGQLLGVSHMVSGSVTKIGSSLYITAKMLDVATTEIINSVSFTQETTSFSDLLTKEIPSLAHDICGIERDLPVANVLVSSYSRKNHILVNGDQIGIREKTIQLPIGDYYLSEIDVKTGVEINSELISLTDTEPQRVHLGGERVRFSVSLSSSLVFPGTANPIPYDENGPQFSSTFIAPGFHVGALIADKHYHAFITHLRFATERSYDLQDWYKDYTTPDVKSFYMGGFYLYQREWRVAPLLKFCAGGALGFRGTRIAYLTTEDGEQIGYTDSDNFEDERDIATYNLSSRSEFGGPVVGFGIGGERIMVHFSMLYTIGIHDIEQGTQYYDIDEGWISVGNTTQSGPKASASPELNISVRFVP